MKLNVLTIPDILRRRDRLARPKDHFLGYVWRGRQPAEDIGDVGRGDVCGVRRGGEQGCVERRT